jgi:predicted site-specific integrase-resolvase
MAQYLQQNYFTVSQLARELKTSRITILKAISEGKIPVEISPVTKRKYVRREIAHTLFSGH